LFVIFGRKDPNDSPNHDIHVHRATPRLLRDRQKRTHSSRLAESNRPPWPLTGCYGVIRCPVNAHNSALNVTEPPRTNGSQMQTHRA